MQELHVGDKVRVNENLRGKWDYGIHFGAHDELLFGRDHAIEDIDSDGDVFLEGWSIAFRPYMFTRVG